MSVLVLAEVDGGALAPATARIVAGAAQLGPVDVLVVGPESAASAAAALQQVNRVLSATVEPVADSLATLIASLAEDYAYVVAAASSAGKDVIPRLAARLDIMPVTDITAILSGERFERPIYAGNAIETVWDPQPRHLLTLRASAFRPVATGGSAGVERLDTPVAAAAHVIAVHRTESDAPDLATAQIVVGGGVSVGSAENFKLIERLAKTLGAAVGATRAAVDAGYAPNDWQVGQTGKVIAPDLYIAVGISGALQHLAGIQGARKIIAINTDPEAPIMKLADLVLVGDLFTVLPELIGELEKRGLP